ncbi:hypothetical protein VCHENC02_5904 [Vibrio harveyi]|uniref:Uncharacterized protein n=1 Tax=Vibrio harveyi TaxID=669 RepID=A0A454CP42_VIBHA|nr:hypothetical protein VCHENC01_5054 [Vibrio harveyi]EKM28172.1 hypothetical protein VCHENC02_5904 [Vibrio harveyi]
MEICIEAVIHRMMASLSAHTLLSVEYSVANTEPHHARNIGSHIEFNVRCSL